MSLESTSLEGQEQEDVFVDELKPGTELMHGQYTIESFLAAGGFGITYLARDSLNRRVVIKECFPGNFCRRQNVSVMPRSRAHQNELTSVVRLFAQEAMSLAKASHPNIVGVHQVFEENNTSYMALDFVQGRDLLEILTEDPDSLTPDQIAGYLEKILGAVQHIHDLGMLHRDISPDNIIISEANEPILIDFGAAREDSSADQKVTRMLSALRVVKDGYSPQEFYIAGSTQGPSCDLYSLAASFYHIITQDMPPDSQSRLQSRAGNEDDPYIPLGDRVEGYSKNFVTALDKAMAILPNERMQSANEWLAHMNNEAFVDTTTEVAAPAFAANTDKAFPMTPVLMGSVAAVAVIAGAFLFLSGGSDPEPVTEEVVSALPSLETSEQPVAEAPAATTDSEPDTAAAAQPDTQPVAPTTDTAAAPAEADPNASGVDFFVNMNTSQPDLVAAPRAGTTVQPSAPAPAPQVTTDQVGTTLVADVPFILSTSQQGLIETALIEGLTPGAQIVSINGEPVGTNAQITERLNGLAATDNAEAFSATFGLSTDGSVSEQSVSVLKQRQIVLASGLAFSVRKDGDNWTTEVVRASPNETLRIGDQLISYLLTSEEISGWQSLDAILSTGAENGTTSFSFAVKRDGIIWVEAFDAAS